MIRALIMVPFSVHFWPHRWVLPVIAGIGGSLLSSPPARAQEPTPEPTPISVPQAEATPLFQPSPSPTPQYLDPLFPLPQQEPEEEQPLPSGVQSRQNPSLGRVIGRVLNPVGQPVAGAQIRLVTELETTEAPEDPASPAPETVDEEDNENQPLVTDEQGSFELFSEQFGRWPLAVWHPDFERATTQIWVQPGLTTPVDVVLETPLEPQPRTRLGVLGVGGLDHTQTLAQRLAGEAVRVGLIPQADTVVALDNRKLTPILREIGWPLYELFEFDRRKPEAVQDFLDYLGLRAVVISRVDVLTRPASPTELNLNSRSRVELWTLSDQGELQVQVLAEASRSATENSDLNAKEISQLYQVQVTEMAREIRDRWQGNDPLAAYFDPGSGLLSPQKSRLDTTVELSIPSESPATPPPEEAPAPES